MIKVNSEIGHKQRNKYIAEKERLMREMNVNGTKLITLSIYIN